MTLVRFASVATLAAAAALFAAATPALAQAKPAKLPKGDAAKGMALFAQCKVCHSLEAGKNGVGPSLKGIVGTKAADVAGYTFSNAMKKSGITWTPQALSDYLTAPMKMVPGTKMPFAGMPKPQDRADVIAYLAKN